MVHRKCNCSTAMACIGHMTCMPAASVDLEMSHFVRQTQMFDKLHGMVLSCVDADVYCLAFQCSWTGHMTFAGGLKLSKQPKPDVPWMCIVACVSIATHTLQEYVTMHPNRCNMRSLQCKKYLLLGMFGALNTLNGGENAACSTMQQLS